MLDDYRFVEAQAVRTETAVPAFPSSLMNVRLIEIRDCDKTKPFRLRSPFR